MQSFLFIAFFAALAGRVLAFSQLTVGEQAITPVSSAISVPAGPVGEVCRAQCTTAITAFDACNNNAACQCRDDVLKPFVDCQQCYFTTLINLNLPAPAPHVGSAGVLAAMNMACVNAQIPPGVAVGLALPNTWDGPRAVDLGLPVEILGVIMFAGLAVAAVLLFNTM